LNAATGISSSTQRAWSATQSASIGLTSSTPMVSWTVIAVTTDSGWQPMLESVMMSDCRPAPPLGSVAANTRTMGGRSAMRKELEAPARLVAAGRFDRIRF
jgi:hypothetical protein